MGINSLIDDAIGLAKANPVTTAVGVGGAAVGVGLGTAALVGAIKRRKNKRHKTRSSRKRGRRIKHTRRGRKQDRKRYNRSQKWERAYRRRKKSNSRRVHYAKKTGQPYIILASGKAKFIKGKRRKM